MGRPGNAKLDTDGLASDLARHLPLLTRHNLLESLASLRWLWASALPPLTGGQPSSAAGETAVKAGRCDPSAHLNPSSLGREGAPPVFGAPSSPPRKHIGMGLSPSLGGLAPLLTPAERPPVAGPVLQAGAEGSGARAGAGGWGLSPAPECSQAGPARAPFSP